MSRTKNIDFSYEQLIINESPKQEFITNNKIKKEADKFVIKQKELSNGLESQQKD